MSNARKLADLLDSSGDVKGLNLDNVDDILGLEAYNNTSTITGNAVDIFIYDTSKDSDGGAWRKRTQDTSWYNEAASTTRGSRKDFPAVAVIVSESGKLTIYDGDTPDLDMWMVFNVGTYSYIYKTPVAIQMLNGQLLTAGNEGLGGASWVDFLGDQSIASIIYASAELYITLPISGRNTNVASNRVTGSRNIKLINRVCNDVAMTVLPNAPIDSATGLPTPTIAVATNGGVSVIKDDGTVVDITASAGSAYNHAGFITFSPDNKLVFEMDSGDRDCYYIGIPSADRTVQTHSGLHTDKVISYDSTSGVNGLGRFKNAVAGKNENTYFAHTEGVSNLIPNISTPKEGSVAYITSKYNTGYMTGDIRGAWNVDTDVTSLSGTDLVTSISQSGTVTSSTTPWYSVESVAGFSISSNVITISPPSWETIRRDVGMVNGKKYVLSINVTRTSGTLYYYENMSNQVLQINSSGVHTFTLTPSGYNGAHLQLSTSNFNGTVNSISVKEAIPDRSVKGNGLAVHGTPTVSAVATGAELKCISGFSFTNYLEQPYNSDLDFGTGDFSVSGWFKGTDPYGVFCGTNTVSGKGFVVSMTGAAGASTYFFSTGTSTSSPISKLIDSDTWVNLVVKRENGVAYIYENGILLVSSANTSSVVDGGTLALGYRQYDTAQNFAGSMALWRISATAPTAEQIKEIYEAEKPLFQENAKCTLNGTSDAVTAMSYDDSNEELLVGTSGGLSVFKGLRRVDENTNNITEVAQQGSLRVEEY